VNAFTRRDGRLWVEDVSLDELAERHGTPLFVYSATALTDNYDALDRALGDAPHTLCYSIKTNMNLAVVRTLVARGAGIDITHHVVEQDVG